MERVVAELRELQDGQRELQDGHSELLEMDKDVWKELGKQNQRLDKLEVGHSPMDVSEG